VPYYDSLIVTVNPNPSAPTISTTAASCSSAGTATITNYAASSTYAFSPTGPSVGAGGVISGLTPATNYTVTATNSNACTSSSSASFSVAAQLPSNTASAASSSPTVCSNNALTNISHSTTGATGITNSGVSGANGLPAGVSATWASNTITVSGTPTAAGTYTYSIPLTGGCGTVNATGTITVTAPTTPTFTQVGPYLSGASIPALQTTSSNGILGTWSPAISNTTTSTYTFTPSAGQCGTTTTMTITINQPLQYTLTANDSSVCAGSNVTLSVNLQPVSSVTDIDGNIYQTVQIGNQIWMAEDLRVTRLNDGTAISQVQSSADWVALSSRAWCYNSLNLGGCNYTGKLYNFWAVTGGKICPTGWHVPSFNEWFGTTGLKTWVSNNYPTQTTNVGGLLKITGTSEWNSPNQGAMNTLGFNARPAGGRDLDGNFFNCGTKTTYHINNNFGGGEAHYVEMSNTSGDIYRISPWRGSASETWKMGVAVRCLKN
jgi:hypothetical protein